MRTLPIAAALLLATAAAEASTLRRIEQIDDDHATLSFVVTTKARDAQEIILPVRIPADMAVTGLTIQIGTEEALVAQPVLAASARKIYDDVVAQIRDPALLELTTRDQLRLSVYPITRKTPARITLHLTQVTKLDGLARVERGTSLVAAPMSRSRLEPYADYWPRHEQIIVAVTEPD